tara:strand:+ start:6323 stop:9109 length:2787 start_codon:yes stop_codon:yes gene_type:complete
MAVFIADNYNYMGNKPLDDKMRAESIAAMKNTFVPFDGLITFLDTNDANRGLYYLEDVNQILGDGMDDATYLDSVWKPVGSGGGGGGSANINSAPDGSFGWYSSTGTTISGLDKQAMQVMGGSGNNYIKIGYAEDELALDVEGRIQLTVAEEGNLEVLGVYDDDDRKVMKVKGNCIELHDFPEGGPGSIKWYDASATPETITLTARPNFASYALTLPPLGPAQGEYLMAGAGGNLAWGTPTGSGSVTNSADAKPIAYYANAGDVVSPTDVDALTVDTGGKELVVHKDGKLLFQDGAHLTATMMTGDGTGKMGVLFKNTGTNPSYLDIEKLSGPDVCVRIEQNETFVGDSTNPALQIGTGGLQFYTEGVGGVHTKAVIRNNLTGTGDYLVLEAAKDGGGSIKSELVKIGQGALEVKGNLRVEETVTGTGPSGYLELGSDIDMNLNSIHNVSIAQIAIINGLNTVNSLDGDIHFIDTDVVIAGGSNQNGDLTVAGNLDVGGTAELDGLDVDGNAEFGFYDGNYEPVGTDTTFLAYGGPHTEPSAGPGTGGQRAYGPTVRGSNYSRLTIECVDPVLEKETNEENPHHDMTGYDGSSWSAGEASPVSGPVLAFDSWLYGKRGEGMTSDSLYTLERYLTRSAHASAIFIFHAGTGDEYMHSVKMSFGWSSQNTGLRYWPSRLQVGDEIHSNSAQFWNGTSYQTFTKVTDVDHVNQYIGIDCIHLDDDPNVQLLKIVPKRRDVSSWEVFKQSRSTNMHPPGAAGRGWDYDFENSYEFESLNFKPIVKKYSNSAILPPDGSTPPSVDYTSELVPTDVSFRIRADGKVEAGTGFLTASTREVKTSIENLSEEKANLILEGLQPVTFEYKTSPGEPRLGFIAEDVPEYVAERNRKSVSTLDIVAALTGALKSQSEKVKTLEKEIEDMKQLLQNSGVI